MFYVSTQPNSALPVSDLGLEQLRISVRSSHSSFPSVVLSWNKRQISSFLCQAVIQTDHTEFAPRSWSEFHPNGIIFAASSGSASVVESVSFRGRPKTASFASKEKHCEILQTSGSSIPAFHQVSGFLVSSHTGVRLSPAGTQHFDPQENSKGFWRYARTIQIAWKPERMAGWLRYISMPRSSGVLKLVLGPWARQPESEQQTKSNNVTYKDGISFYLLCKALWSWVTRQFHCKSRRNFILQLHCFSQMLVGGISIKLLFGSCDASQISKARGNQIVFVSNLCGSAMLSSL